MVFALGAVFAPLFILLGLQEGIVGNMIDRLKSDSESRLVTPKFPLRTSLDDGWLQSLERRSEVVITSPTSHLLLDIEGIGEPVNAIPTIPEDPLLTENGISLKGYDRPIVISNRFAQHAGKTMGDNLTVILVRHIGQEEKVPVQFRVVKILPITASADVKVWLPLPIFRWFYKWRKGQAVPQLGLTGKGNSLIPEYDGIQTLLKTEPSDGDYRRMIAGKISFSQPPQPCEIAAWDIPPNHQARLWKPINSRVFKADFRPLVNRHHELGYAVDAVPFLDEFEVTLRTGDRTVQMFLTILPDTPKSDSLSTNPKGTQHVWIARAQGFIADTAGELSFDSGDEGRDIHIPVRLNPSRALKAGYIAVAREFAGKMNAARNQEASYDSVTGEFSPLDEDMRFFRAYTRSIDELEALVEFVRQEGGRRASDALREPSSKVEEVRNIHRLAGYMEQLYFLIVIISGISGIFAIAANVYAGVHRKRRDLAYLALLGVNRGALFLFPYLKSVVLITGGIFLALIAYAVFGHFSDQLFAHVIGDAESLTRLTMQNISVLLAGIYAAGSLASFFAAIKIMRIEPGEYIRE
ncbi:MAG: ABC transporter permease [bacterium]|nr:ABC transporter permease [bacterium]